MILILSLSFCGVSCVKDSNNDPLKVLIDILNKFKTQCKSNYFSVPVSFFSLIALSAF